MQALTTEKLDAFSSDFQSVPSLRVAMNAVVNQGINAVAKDFQVERSLPHDFSIRLSQGEITNQKRSGRCWMFAALNTMRVSVMQKLNLDIHIRKQVHLVHGV